MLENCMIKKTLFITSVLLLLGSLYIFGNNGIKEILPQLDDLSYEALLKGEIISSTTLEGNKITQFFPPNTYGEKNAAIAQLGENSFSLTALSYIPYGPKLKAMSKEERQLAIFNTMRAISTQEGITYISFRAGNKPRVLIEKSRYIEGPKNRTSNIPDPVETTFPLSANSYVYQKDSTFSGNVYEHIYTNSQDEIYVSIKNLDSMRAYGIATAVPKEKLSIALGTYQLEEGLLMYALTTIVDREPKIKVLWYTVDLPSSFKRRVTALMEWFVARLDTLEMSN
ncbi:MAG: hypothetical protein EOM67_02435 [Spirochaetia bacterium]|nr:hypothetical protein [Spirochaetia bacterium]